MKTLLLIFTLFLPCRMAAAGASANDPAQAAVTVPLLGYAYDTAAQRIQPIQGIPGAALSGAPVSTPQNSVVAVSNELDYALFAGAGNPTTVLDLRSGADVSIPGSVIGAAQIALSPGGTAAALYYDSGLIEIVTGLPAAPVAARTVQTAWPAKPAILAIGDDGQSLAVVLEDGETLSSDGDTFQPLPVPGWAAALAFSPGSRDIAVATRDGQIWSVGQENGRPKYTVAGSGTEGETPAAIEFSRDGSRVVTAFTDGHVAVFDFTGNPPAVISCGCSPRSLHRGKGNSLFLLEDTSATLPQLLDGSGAAPRFFFIPKPAEDNLQ
jgi:hypothetical protein